jgi:hypothetical protein
METVKFKWVGTKKWKTLKHLGEPFTDMEEAIKFVRHNKAKWGLQLKLQNNRTDALGGELQWDNL